MLQTNVNGKLRRANEAVFGLREAGDKESGKVHEAEKSHTYNGFCA